MAYKGQSVHIGCSFSIIEIIVVLYRSVLNLGDGTPSSKDRDYLVLSKGHGVMALYACFKELAWLSDASLDSYLMDGTELKGLSESDVPGLEVSSGSLGHGLSVGVGLALGATLKKTNQKVFCIVGDGEMNEGSIWEGLMFAAHYKLNNFLLIVDKNEFQAMGKTEEVMCMNSLSDKIRAFGFSVVEVDGHDEKELLNVITQLINEDNLRPKAIVASTVKGKGVSFMEGNNIWHYTRLNEATYQASLLELEQES